MIYVLVDDIAGRARLAELQAALGDPNAASLNTSAFDGARLELSELMAACEAMPFLSDRRLVLVRGLLGRSGSTGAGESRRGARTDHDDALATYLARVPTSTDLVFLEPNPPPKGALLRAIERLAADGRAAIVSDAPMDERAALDWTRRRAVGRGGRIDPDAAMALIAAVGPDPRAIDRELEKLLLWAADRSVATTDVSALVTSADSVRVFELVDAIGNRNARGAVHAWRTLRHAGEDPHRLLALVARQFRLLIQAAELALGRGANAAQVLGLPPRVASGLMAQARRWSIADLEAVQACLVELDHESKTGGLDLEASLEALIAELVSGRGQATWRITETTRP